MQPRSLSTRLLLSVSAVLVVFFGITILALDFVFRDLSERAIRDRLEVQVIALLSASEEDEEGGLRPQQLAEPRFDNPGSGLYAQIAGIRAAGTGGQVVTPADRHNESVWRSKSLTGSGLVFPAYLRIGERRFGELRRDDGTLVLGFSMGIDWQFSDGTMRPFVYSVAESLEPYYAQLRRLRGGLFGGFGILMALLLGTLALLLRRLLAPLRRVEQEIEAIEAGELTELGGGYPRELLGITTNLNTLLHSERERMARYRNTLGNLAHSFKTPLAVMRNLLGSSPARLLPMARQLDEQVDRMDEMVNYQLKRAAAAGGTGLGNAPVDVGAALEALRGALLKVYADRDIDCELRVSEDCMYRGDREDLTEIAGNLLDNAFKWCRGRVRMSAQRWPRPAARRDGLQLLIEDDGPGIPEEERSRVLERGARLDEHISGQGIGLSVVRELVRLNGGSLSIGISPLGGACIAVQLAPN
ncbi:two-component system, OmpR family, sensor histidine kinase PhoQ [Steroidobacter denitrificans]|uniref:histidine kinase n=1 Tax=Steroidobacter denitrificans TaxID=465721 RepID=A0A127FBT7_STEDE|nr:ATP-binding protein [Steroidobacter denitrificans]AMN47068.1 two-component system, OmpR family, sensor histidine kinase PhoQ [Steroidobacter denitrificans]